MLQSLHIKNYVLIDSLEIDFPSGLVIITGQTGAGKSILLGALSLLMGAKADASVLLDSEETCVIEAVFSLKSNEHLQAILEKYDIDSFDDSLIIRRTIAKSGRSRAFINDLPVSVDLLKDLSSSLLDIHSQHQTQILSNKSFQLSILDYFASNEDLKRDYFNSWNRVNNLTKELQTLKAKLKDLEANSQYNKQVLDTLEKAKIQSGELLELESLHKQLSNAEEIKILLHQIAGDLSSLEGESLSIDSRLKDAVKNTTKLATYMPSCEPLIERLESARLELQDLYDELQTLDSNVYMSASELNKVEERMSLLYSLLKKYDCSTEQELLDFRDEIASQYLSTEDVSIHIEDITRDLDIATKEMSRLAASLTKSREKAASLLEKDLVDMLRYLELEHSVFKIDLRIKAYSATGTDEPDFKFSANGTELQNIEMCASGGEKSRIMLSLKALMARFENMPTMIFDEIDTGVSGSVADKMGRMICEMGKNMQVFAITHLPQVAAQGNIHFLVSKEVDGGVYKSSIRQIDGDERVLEIARLLSGETISKEAIANAHILLKK